MTRTIVCGSLLVLAGCGGGLVESQSVAPGAAPAPAPTPPPFEPMALLPDRSFAVGQMDLARSRESAVWPRLLGLVERLQSSSGLSERERERLGRFVEVARSARQVVFGAAESPTGRDARLVVVIEGMPPAELPSFIQSMGTGPAAPVAGGYRAGEAAGAVIEGRWVLSTAEELPQLASRRAEGVTPFAGSPALAAAAPGARFGQAALSLAVDSTRRFVKDRVLSDLLIGAEPSVIEGTNSAAFWVDTRDGIEANLELRADTPEVAALLAAKAQAQLTSLRSELLLIPFGVRDLVDATHVTSVDKTASVRFEASEALALGLLERLEGFLSLTLEGSLAADDGSGPPVSSSEPSP